MGLIVTPTRNAATDRVRRRRADRRIERHREQRTGSDIQSAIDSPRFRWDVGSLGVIRWTVGGTTRTGETAGPRPNIDYAEEV